VVALIDPLLDGDDRGGVFGRVAGMKIQRLPSSVYWSGLRSWNILRKDWSQAEYHVKLPGLKAARRNSNRRRKDRRDHFEDDSPDGLETWHSKLPDPPDDFPEINGFRLSYSEADFLQDRLRITHPDSFMAWLTHVEYEADIQYPWLHPMIDSASPSHQNLLRHARIFSGISHGASRLYNLLLAEQAGLDDWAEEHRSAFVEWAEGPDPGMAQDWDLSDFWNEITLGGRAIKLPARQFVESWVSLVSSGSQGLMTSSTAHALIRNRERRLKGSRSRFSNSAARNQWKGQAGLTRLSYRWPVVSTLLKDLREGLTGGQA